MKATRQRESLIDALVELARDLPPETMAALAQDLEAGGDVVKWARLEGYAATRAMKDRLRTVAARHAVVPEVRGPALAFALLAAAQATRLVTADHGIEIAWTGPDSQSVPLRRVDQIIYELVESASHEVLLITYAAYRAERVLGALRAATDRGAHVRLVIELAEESGGKLSFDNLRAIREAVPRGEVFCWPMERRPRNAAGGYGAMHAKALIADRNRALVSSANLTDYALETNMELGLVAEGSVAKRLANHFDELILRRELLPAR